MVSPRNDLEAALYPRLESMGEEWVRLNQGSQQEFTPEESRIAYEWLQRKITARNEKLEEDAALAAASAGKAAFASMFAAFWTMVAALVALASVLIPLAEKHHWFGL